MGKANQLVTADPVKSRADEALEIMEQICDFADNLFELDLEQKQNISPNKVSRVKKDKNGEKVEVVSVADELFPYEGDAKQQFNQKVLAKINDMIEGTGSLEDLIQFVRKGVATKKVHEAVEKYVDKEGNTHELEFNKIEKDGRVNKFHFNHKINGKSVVSSSDPESNANYERKHAIKNYGLTKVEESKDPKGYKENMDIANHYDHLYSKEPANSPDGSPNPVAAEYKRKYQEYFDKAMKCHYGEGKKVSEAYDEIIGFLSDLLAEAKDPVHSNPISRELRGEKAIRDQHSDDVVKYAGRVDKATGYRKQVNLERAADADKAATEASKKFRQHKGAVLDYFRKKGDNNVEAHKKLSRMMGAYEALEEIKNVAEGLFKKDERGDLLDDIDTALGSPVKKKLADIKAKMTGCKETKVHEALDLMEEIISEVSAGYVKKKAEAVIDKRKAEADHAYNFARKVHNYEVNKTGDNKNTPMTDKADNQSYEKGGRWAHAYSLSKHLPDSKKPDRKSVV